MKLASFISSCLLGVLSIMSVNSCASAATDFNEIGKKVSLLLQNAHYERMKREFNSDLSQQVFDTYLKILDPSRIFFTQEDVDKLRHKYGPELDGYFLAGETMTPAKEMYNLFKKRAIERITYAQDLLTKNNFTFDQDKTIERTRKDAPWPKNKEEAELLWKDRVEEQMLSEVLRRETIAKLAEKQGKPDPSKDEKTPSERLKLRYERILHTLKEADEEDMADYLLSALSRTFDPHTEYWSARELDRNKSSMKGSLIGIGALLGEEDDGATKIIGIVLGGPADKSNKLKLNDRIIGIDSNNDGEMTDILYMKIDKVVDMVRGKEGTQVRLKIEPHDSPGQAKIITLTRSQVELKDEFAKGELIEEKDYHGSPRKIGIITLPSFYFDMDGGDRHSSKDMLRLIDRMNNESVDGLVIDLRGNGGGSLEEVRRMTGFFVGGGPVVQIKDGTRGIIEIKKADDTPPVFTKPVVVLIDKTSASASEILAAALQDYGRAVILGDTSSFGKGTVQQPIEIGRHLPFFADASRAGALKITTQKFYRVAGGSTQHKGVLSDIIIPSATAAFELGESTLDYALPHDSIRPAKNYKKDPYLATIMPELQKRSKERVEANKDFALLTEEINRTKAKVKENKLSLSKEVRQKEIDEQEKWRNRIVQDRKNRYPQIAKQDKDRYNMFRMTLDDLKLKNLPKSDWEKDKESSMIVAKGETDDLNDAPDLPSGLDWGAREALNVVNDIIDLSAQKTVAESKS